MWVLSQFWCFPLTMLCGAKLLFQTTLRRQVLVASPTGIQTSTRCFSAINGNDAPELLAREKEVLKVVKPELQQGYRWLQRFEQNKAELMNAKERNDMRGVKTVKQKKRKKRGKKGKKKKKGYPSFVHDIWSPDHEDYLGNPIPNTHALIGRVKTSLKLRTADIADLEVLEAPNPYNTKYSDLRWVDLKKATAIASEKHGGAGGFLDSLTRTAGGKNKQINGRSGRKELTKLKNSPDANAKVKEIKMALRDTYQLPFYSNDPALLRSLNGMSTLSDTAVKACARRHFLMTFTEFPLIRNERSSLLMWVSRFDQGVEKALEFQSLPTSMHLEVERLWREFFEGHKPEEAQKFESIDHQYDAATLEARDAANRDRAQRFISRGLPNAAEAALVENVLDGSYPELTNSFPFLFRVEWVPTSGRGQGDMIFVNREGTRFAVIEAKANTKGQPSKVTHVKRQSKFYSDALRNELRDTPYQIYSGYVTDQGFWWLSEAPETTAPSAADSIANIPSTKDEARKKELEAMAMTGLKAERFDILKHEQTNAGDGKADKGASWVTPSRREQLEAMTIEHELKALCYLYCLRPIPKRKQEFVERIWSFENSSEEISAGF